MRIRVEASGLQIGVDNAITKAIQNNEWGLRFSFQDDGYRSRAEFVLDFDALKDFEFVLERETEYVEVTGYKCLLNLPVLHDYCRICLSHDEAKELKKQISSAKEEIAKINQIIK